MNPLPAPNSDADKDQRGRVLVVAGSASVPGGALLAATAALRAGAGKLQIATCEKVAVALGVAMPEALVIGLPETSASETATGAGAALLERVQCSDAVLIGPGMTDDDNTAQIVVDVLRSPPGPAFVFDAAALSQLQNAREEMAAHSGRIVITPHAGEMAALLNVTRKEVCADPYRFAREVAVLLNCVVVLKGAVTTIVDPEEQCWTYQEGSVGLATSGSGDTLAGVVAGLLARGALPQDAAQWAVYLHGEAGNRLARKRGPIGYLARELLDEIPALMARTS